MFELMPWKRNRGFMEMSREMDRFFEDIFGGRSLGLVGEKTFWAPAVDVTETDKAFVFKAEIPGVDAKDVEVSFHNGLLTIRGERKLENEEKKESYHRVERSYGSFSRSFRIPVDVDIEKANADYDKGIMTITLPKVEAEAPRKIEVKAA